MKVTTKELHLVEIFDSDLSKSELSKIKFNMYFENDKGNKIVNNDLDGNVFLEWLEVEGICRHDTKAGMAESGVPCIVAGGTIRWEKLKNEIPASK